MSDAIQAMEAVLPGGGRLDGRRFHMVGIGGCGMCPLAQMLLSRGAAVTGSDRSFDRGESAEVRGFLESAGARILPQDGSGSRQAPDAVVVSTAVEAAIPDLAEARAAGIPVFLRGELLAFLCRSTRLVAVGGTSGKSTVVAMVGWILHRAGLDPGIYNGAPMIDFAANDRRGDFVAGSGDLFCSETDESDGTVTRFHPWIGAITNLSRDHKEIDELERLFATFARRTAGPLVLGDGSSLDPVAEAAGRDAIRVGRTDRADVRFDLVSEPGEAVRFRILGEEIPLRLYGEHNASNAALAFVVAREAGADARTAAESLAEFRGVRRRLEVVGRGPEGVVVVDDYAHNPAKLAASTGALKPRATRLTLVFRPHGYGPARRMREELGPALSGVFGGEDRVFLLPIYDAGGTARRDISSEDLAEALREAGVQVGCVADGDEAVRRIRDDARPGEIIVVSGARDPHLGALARRIASAVGALPA